MYFLDTNICVYFLNNKFHQIREKMRTILRNEIRVPAVVMAELYYGAAKSVKRDYNLIRYARFAALYEIIHFDHKTARVYGDIRAALETKGQIIGGNDLLIAASALANDAVLVTNNTGEFSRVDGLVTEDWTKE
ncbi:MAG: type II toxin-antitoxin system VapC family toxin [Oscillospiraceae bacterium]|nr:type II toxin-antitoxin system VapC family toxin [Oscillospiraceae bacterium]